MPGRRRDSITGKDARTRVSTVRESQEKSENFEESGKVRENR